MRTTVTLDPDVAALVRKAMRSGRSFKDVVNEAIRRGLIPASAAAKAPPLPAFDMGKPRIPVVKALQLAGELEDEEIVRKMALRK